MLSARVVIVSLGVMNASALAQIDYVSQEREVRLTFQTPSAPSVVDGSSDVGLFGASVSDSVFDDFTGQFSAASATQVSLLGADQVSMEGAVSAFSTTDGFASARSSLDALISISEATAFSVSASLFDLSQGNPSFSFFAELVDDGGNGSAVWTFSSGSEFIPDVGDFEFDPISGELGPGEYSLSVVASAGGFKDATTEGSFRFDLLVPAPGTAVAPMLLAMVGVRRRR